MITMKKKLIVSVAMLVISALMLTTASFAWFTISAAPEMTDLSAKVVVNDNLEIALDDGTYVDGDDVDEASAVTAAVGSITLSDYTWGSLVDFTSLLAGVDTTLIPITYDAATSVENFIYPLYGLDGRIASFEKLEGRRVNATSPFFGNIVQDGTNDVGSTNPAYGFYVDFWLRSNVGGDVVLSTAVKRDGSNGSINGGGSTFTSNQSTDADEALAENIRISFEDITIAGADMVLAVNKYTTGTSDNTTTFECAENGKIVTLTANKAKKIRMYVYLDGKGITNASASLSAKEVGPADAITVGGKLNVQFALEDETLETMNYDLNT